MHITIKRAHLALLFAILFVSVGWLAPAMYASYAPQSHFIELNSFTAEDATVDAGRHNLCFDRDVKKPNTAEVLTELYLVSGSDNERIEVATERIGTFLQEGDTAVRLTHSLPDNLSAGSYRYVLTVEMSLTNGRVERTFSFKSNQFRIVKSVDGVGTNKTFC